MSRIRLQSGRLDSFVCSTEGLRCHPALKAVALRGLFASSLASQHPCTPPRRPLSSHQGYKRQLRCDTCTGRRALISAVFSTSPSGILLKPGWGERRLKLHLPALPRSARAVSSACKCVKALLCPQVPVPTPKQYLTLAAQQVG